MSRFFATSSLPALLAACDNPISNQIFVEDAEFLAALPNEERHTVRFVEDLEADDDAAKSLLPLPGQLEEPDLSLWGEELAVQANLALAELMLLTSYARDSEPSLREESVRSWGPTSLSTGTRALLLADVVRSGVGQYDWAFQLAENSAGPWESFFSGTHFAGATVAEGSGSFQADLSLLALHQERDGEGMVEAVYDDRDGALLDLALSGYRASLEDEPLDARLICARSSQGGGDFQYEASVELLAVGSERTLVRARWNANGEVRADALASGGELEEELGLSQCWDGAGSLVYQLDDQGLYQALGSEDDCAFRQASYADDL